VRLSEFPFQQVDSQRCFLYFELAHNASRAEKELGVVMYHPYKCLITDLEHQKRKTAQESPERRIQWQNPSSKARLSYMSPASQAKRRKYTQYDRTNTARKLVKFEDSEIQLDDPQNEEMQNIVQSIDEDN